MIEIVLFLSIPFLAVFFEGVHRKLIAHFQNRMGPPVLQPFYDLKKLWDKEMLQTQNDPFFMTAPIFLFLSTYAFFLVVPFPLISFNYDFIFLIYLTILASAFYSLAGISSDSPYSIISATREMVLMICFEMTLTVTVFTFMMSEGVLSLSALSSPAAFFSLPLASLCLFIVGLVELKITPFDTSEAKTEILTGTETEYPGKQLFFIELAKYMKRLFFLLLLPLLFFGVQNPLLFILVGLFMLVLFSLSQVTTPRYRLDQAFRVLFIVLILALVEFVRVSWGFTWAL